MTKAKLSTVVAKQLPEFIRDDYPAFVEFIEAYYEFLEQVDPKNLAEIRSIDDTLDIFIDHFKAELANNLPNVLVDQRQLLQRLKEQYLSKGSESSFKLLFRLLYNKEVVVDYPGRQMLRASDGRWYQDVTIFARIKSGDPASIVGQYIEVITPIKTVSIRVDNYRYATVYDRSIETGESVARVSNEVIEIFIDRKFYGEIQTGNIIKHQNIFEAAILPTTSKVKVVTRGAGFKAGQLFNIRSSLGEGTILKISKVNSEGGIQSVQLIKFGIGYTTDFSTTISPPSKDTFTPLTVIGNTVNVNDRTGGFVETGLILKDDYSTSAFEPTYAGKVLREFYYDDAQVPDPENAAQLQFTLGPLAKYPGYYTDNLGFLDDAIYIQDGHYYQSFSYILKIDERLSSYKNIVKTLLHPAGTALFGGYELKNEFSVSPEIISILQFLAAKFETVLDSPIDEILGKIFGKALSDTQNILEIVTSKDFGKALSDSTDELQDQHAILVSKGFTDTVNQPSDSATKTFSKAALDSAATSDNISSRDFGKALNDSQNIIETISSIVLDKAPIEDSVDLLENAAILISKTFNDSVTILDLDIEIKPVNYYVDLASASEILGLAFQKNVNDSIVSSESSILAINKVIDDSITSSESGFVEFNPYIDPVYTYVISGEHYVGERTTF